MFAVTQTTALPRTSPHTLGPVEMDHFSGFVYTALLEWVSEYAVQAYTTSDSVVSYLNDVRIASTTPSFAV